MVNDIDKIKELIKMIQEGRWKELGLSSLDEALDFMEFLKAKLAMLEKQNQQNQTQQQGIDNVVANLIEKHRQKVQEMRNEMDIEQIEHDFEHRPLIRDPGYILEHFGNDVKKLTILKLAGLLRDEEYKVAILYLNNVWNRRFIT